MYNTINHSVEWEIVTTKLRIWYLNARTGCHNRICLHDIRVIAFLFVVFFPINIRFMIYAILLHWMERLFLSLFVPCYRTNNIIMLTGLKIIENRSSYGTNSFAANNITIVCLLIIFRFAVLFTKYGHLDKWSPVITQW